jgi:hypothetical protein
MPLFDLFWAMLWFFIWIAWIWLVISVIFDIFRSHDIGGVAKALWALFVVLLPFLGVFLYLIVRGGSMQERRMDMARQSQAAADDYVRSVASSGSSADELEKLAGLRDAGTISDAEFEQAKAKVLGG